MILSEIRDYMRSNGQVAVTDLAYHFDVEPDAIRGMLAHWVRKGKARKMPSGTVCGGGCNMCPPEQVEIYQWIDNQWSIHLISQDAFSRLTY